MKSTTDETEEQSEFVLRGKPYKDQFNGERLSKVDYENKYSSMTEKIKINFPGMSIGQDGSIIPTKDFLKQRRQFKKNLQEQAGLQNLFKSRKSILKTGDNDLSKERKKTTFGTVQDLLQEFNKTPQSNSEIRLPTITPHVAGFKEILSHQLPGIICFSNFSDKY